MQDLIKGLNLTEHKQNNVLCQGTTEKKKNWNRNFTLGNLSEIKLSMETALCANVFIATFS